MLHRITLFRVFRAPASGLQHNRKVLNIFRYHPCSITGYLNKTQVHVLKIIRARSHLNCTRTHSSFLCDSDVTQSGMIALNQTKSSACKNALYWIAWYHSIRGKQTLCVWGVIKIILALAADHTSSVFWLHWGKCVWSVGFPHCILVWTSPESGFRKCLPYEKIRQTMEMQTSQVSCEVEVSCISAVTPGHPRVLPNIQAAGLILGDMDGPLVHSREWSVQWEGQLWAPISLYGFLAERRFSSSPSHRTDH